MPPRLLVTDDALIIREMIKDCAIQAGWEIAGEATHGEEAVERFLETAPDAITLDLIMPEYGGIYALEKLREHSADVFILVISAIEQTSVLKDALRLGASDFVVKPFQTARLTATLRTIATRVSRPAAGQTLSPCRLGDDR